MKINQIKKIAVIGSGIMGHGFALVFARKGYPVFLLDIDAKALKKARNRIVANLNTFLKNGLMGDAEKGEVLERITATMDWKEAAGGVDFVLEAVPEVLALKKEVFRKLAQISPAHAILASNTSGLSITEIGSATRRPQKTIIVHGANPPHIVPVVEIVRGAKTSDETADLCYRLMLKLGKKPVRLLKEVPGFLLNRLQFALYREALHCLEAGVARPEDIDLVVKAGYGFRSAALGPLETSDFGGLDTFLRICRNLFPHLADSPKPPRLLEELVNEGKLGVKTGEGFYRYPKAVLKRKLQQRDRHLIQLLNLYAGRPTGISRRS